MQDLVGRHAAALPTEAVHAVRLAALLSSPHLADLGRGRIADPTTLDAVEEAGLVVVGADDRVRFVHPVHARAVRASIPAGVRRRMHADARRGRAPTRTSAPATWRAVRRAPDARRRRTSSAARPREPVPAARPRWQPSLYDRAASSTPTDDPDARHDLVRLKAVQCLYDCGDYPRRRAGRSDRWRRR